MVQVELARRDRIRDAINALSTELQNNARVAERQRRLLWDAARSKHLARGGKQQRSAEPRGGDPPKSGPPHNFASSTCQNPIPSNASRSSDAQHYTATGPGT